MRLTATTREGAPVAELEVGPEGARLTTSRDPGLQAVLEELQAEPHLPLTIRQTVGGARHVSCKRLTPQDPDYWQALAEALTRKTGYRVDEAR
ncbi:MAG: hypothetical protein ACLGIN_08840 [Candidatus Sericytochromatia bacterium]